MKNRIWAVLSVLALALVVAFGLLPLPAAQAGAVTSPTIEGAWSYTVDGTYTPFNTGSPKIGELQNTVSENFFAKFTVTFPAGTQKKVSIKLADGLHWVETGFTGIPVAVRDSVTSLPAADRTILNYPGVTSANDLYNGTVTYSLKDGAAVVTIIIQVKQNLVDDYSKQADAIIATATMKTPAGADASASTKLDQLEYSTFEGLYSVVPFRREAEVNRRVSAGYNMGRIYNYITNTPSPYRYRAFQSIQMTVSAPDGATPVDTVTVGNSVTNYAEAGWTITGGTSDPDRPGNNLWVFTITKETRYGLGISPVWIFDGNKFANGDVIEVFTPRIEWLYYGQDPAKPYVRTFEKTAGNTHTYLISDTERMYVDSYNFSPDTVIEGTLRFDTQWNSPEHLDAYGYLGRYTLGNRGGKDSVPKWVEFNFPTADIGVNTVTVIGKYSASPVSVKVSYKLNPGDPWTDTTVNIPVNNGAEPLRFGVVSTKLLGLPETAEFAAFRYALDYEDSTDPNNVYRYGVRSGDFATYSGMYYGKFKRAIGPTEVITTPVTISNIYPDTPEIKSITGKSETVSTQVASSISVLTTENKQLYLPGETIRYNATIYGYNSGGTHVIRFSQTPIIYIRDETGQGITNVKLTGDLPVGSPNYGVELLSKYADILKVEEIAPETTDYNGDGIMARVYKIDTSPLAAKTEWVDRYAAAVGVFSPTYAHNRQLRLTWETALPTRYNDNETPHKNPELVYVTDPIMQAAVSTQAIFGDPFDVDRDGVLLPDKLIVGMSNNNTFFQIKSLTDILVLSKARPAGGTYQDWDTTLPGAIKVDFEDGYDVQTTVTNLASFPTSDAPSYFYIPVPKVNQEWGEINDGYPGGATSEGAKKSTFGFTSYLKSQVTNPDSNYFTIEYGTYPGAAAAQTPAATVGDQLKGLSWSPIFNANANAIRITGTKIPNGVDYNFEMSLASDVPTNPDNAVNIYKPVYWEDLSRPGAPLRCTTPATPWPSS